MLDVAEELIRGPTSIFNHSGFITGAIRGVSLIDIFSRSCKEVDRGGDFIDGIDTSALGYRTSTRREVSIFREVRDVRARFLATSLS